MVAAIFIKSFFKSFSIKMVDLLEDFLENFNIVIEAWQDKEFVKTFVFHFLSAFMYEPLFYSINAFKPAKTDNSKINTAINEYKSYIKEFHTNILFKRKPV